MANWICTKCRLTRRHSTPALLITILLGIIFFTINQYLLEFPSTNINDKYYIAKQHMRSMNINQCIECWKQILSLTVINNLIDDTSIHSRTNKCPFHTDQPDSLLLTLLIDHTIHSLQDTFIKTHFSQSITYRDILSIKRLVMIIYEYHKIPKNTIYKSFLHTIHRIIIKHFKPNQKHKRYFNIHISKSGGTSICKTFNNLPFIQTIKTPTHSTVCNYRMDGHRSINCKDTYSKTNDYDMVAKETALDVFYDKQSDDYHPKLCHNFIYLLPFRHPLEKGFSWAQGDNVLYYHSRTQFYQLLHDKRALKDIKYLQCYEQCILINGFNYSRVSKGHHYQNFFGELFSSENMQQIPLNNWEDALKEQDEYKTVSDALNITLPKCMHMEQKDQHWVYIFFNQNNEPGSEFMLRYRKSQWPFPGLRLPRSSSGNTFVSWLGYGDENTWPMSAQLNPRFMIKYKHFVNAYLLMLGIDYVLPFWRYLDVDNIDSEKQHYSGMNKNAHKIWRVAYMDIIQHFISKGYKYMNNSDSGQMGWANIGHTTGRSEHIHSHKVAENITVDDIRDLRNNNQYDLALFLLAQWIARVDVSYHELLRSTKVGSFP